MELDVALKGMFDVQNKLRSRQGINDPVFMSEQMMRLSQYTGAVEEKLADEEKKYDEQIAFKLKKYMLDEQMKPTPAEARAKMDLGITKGQISYLSRLVGSSWKQVGVIQSRINHLTREATSTNM